MIKKNPAVKMCPNCHIGEAMVEDVHYDGMLVFECITHWCRVIWKQDGSPDDHIFCTSCGISYQERCDHTWRLEERPQTKRDEMKDEA